MIKKIIPLAFLLVSVLASAQFVNPGGRGGVRRPPVNQKAQKPDVNIEKMVGFVVYDVEKTLKKLSIKKSNEHYNTVKSIFEKHNKEQKDFIRINGFTLSEAKKALDSAQEKAQEAQDFSILQKAYLKVSENLKPAMKLAEERDKKLDEALEKLLSKKQLKRWKTYKTRVRRSKK